nr:hypothetical protein HK105_005970 [Polyrhizophydium stewartii]
MSDILHIRHRTTQIVEMSIIISGRTFRFFDVGGQRGDRKRWIPYFDDVHSILFIASLADYDQVLVEDTRVNRMIDSLALFETIFNHKLLQNSGMILFLNKKDLFEAKIADSPISMFFPDYDPSKNKDVKHATSFFKKKFKKSCMETENGNSKRQLYIHTTTCTDTKSMQFIINAVM